MLSAIISYFIVAFSKAGYTFEDIDIVIDEKYIKSLEDVKYFKTESIIY
jgi:hypothetical protein